MPFSPRRHILVAAGLAAAWLAAASGSADTMFVSTFLNGSIVRFDLPSPTATTIVNGLISPEDGACHPDGRIYFAESSFNELIRWEQDGTNPTLILPAAGLVQGPEGLSFDLAGNLYMNTRESGGLTDGAWFLAGGDPANPATQIVPPFGNWGEGSAIVLAGPHAGALLLAARGEQRVHISEPPGAPLTVLIDTPVFPAGVDLFGIEVNGCGEIFVAWSDQFLGGGEVWRFDANGVFLEVYAAGFSRVNFLDFDSDGNLFVCDSNTETVFQIAPDKTVTPFALVPGFPTGLAICRDRPVPLCGIECDAGGPYEAECAGETTCLDLDGSGTLSAGGLPLTYHWTSDCPGADFGGTENDVGPRLCLTSGGACEVECTATLEASDGINVESCDASVRVVDTTPPVVPGSGAELGCMWPPNHWYICFTAADLGLEDASDCNPVELRFTGCVSDQPDDARESDPGSPFNGDGHTTEDCLILDGGRVVCARSERAGRGPAAQDGRHYGITVAASDSCGSTSGDVGIGFLHVPHDQGPHERPCFDPTKVGCRPNQQPPGCGK